MYKWRAKAWHGLYFALAQTDVNLRVLHMFEDTFSLDTAHIISGYSSSFEQTSTAKVLIITKQ